jgi:hypothetical protein
MLIEEEIRSETYSDPMALISRDLEFTTKVARMNSTETSPITTPVLDIKRGKRKSFDSFRPSDRYAILGALVNLNHFGEENSLPNPGGDAKLRQAHSSLEVHHEVSMSFPADDVPKIKRSQSCIM